MTDQPAATTSRKHRLRISHAAWFLLACVAVGGWFALSLRSQERLVRVPTVVVPVPAFYVLTDADVHLEWMPEARVPTASLRAYPARARILTLRRLAPDAPIPEAALGPEAGGLAGQLQVVGVPASPAMALSGRLRAGDHVDVIATAGLTRLKNVLVVSVDHVSDRSRPFSIVLALPAARNDMLDKELGTGAVTLIRR